METLNLFSIIVFFSLLQNAFLLNDPIIELPTGKILGRKDTTFANTSYYVFQGIPYATPPVGSLRFKTPQPAQKWDGILNTTSINVRCHQLESSSDIDSEDCLYLSVYTPQLPEDESSSFPVMLFIHGGAFIVGSGIDMHPDLFVDNDVILITINYRLGAFGFLSTQDDVIPGNNGLKDQKLAIEWTYQNINLFGGDKERITVFGQSAGSASVSYQLLNQNNKDLIRGVILESGTFLCPWSYQRQARAIAFGTASILDSSFLTSDNSTALLEFLLTLSDKELDDATEKFLSITQKPWDYEVSQGSIFAPVIEAKNPDAFFTKKMYGMLQASNVLTVPAMVGINSEEILMFNQEPKVLQAKLEAFDENLDLIVPNDMQINATDVHAQMAIKIRDIYTNGENFTSKLGNGLRVYASDNGFSRPVTKFAELYSSVADTYYYQFSYDGDIGNVSTYYEGADRVAHGEELNYLFCSGSRCDFSKYPESDQITSKRLIKLWTDFAKYQNPTPEASVLLQNISWPKLSTEDGDFLYLDINENLEIKNHPKADVLQEWFKLYDSLGDVDFDTY